MISLSHFPFLFPISYFLFPYFAAIVRSIHIIFFALLFLFFYWFRCFRFFLVISNWICTTNNNTKRELDLTFFLPYQRGRNTRNMVLFWRHLVPFAMRVMFVILLVSSVYLCDCGSFVLYVNMYTEENQFSIYCCFCISKKWMVNLIGLFVCLFCFYFLVFFAFKSSVMLIRYVIDQAQHTSVQASCFICCFFFEKHNYNHITTNRHHHQITHHHYPHMLIRLYCY